MQLIELPTEILHTICIEWLQGIKELSVFDVALCGKEFREKYIVWKKHVETVEITVDDSDDCYEVVEIVTQWTSCRNVSFDIFHLVLADEIRLSQQSIPWNLLSSCLTIHISVDSRSHISSISVDATIFYQVAQARKLIFENCMLTWDDDDLSQSSEQPNTILSTTPPLQSLSLINCTTQEHSPILFFHWIARRFQQLQTLSIMSCDFPLSCILSLIYTLPRLTIINIHGKLQTHPLLLEEDPHAFLDRDYTSNALKHIALYDVKDQITAYFPFLAHALHLQSLSIIEISWLPTPSSIQLQPILEEWMVLCSTSYSWLSTLHTLTIHHPYLPLPHTFSTFQIHPPPLQSLSLGYTSHLTSSVCYSIALTFTQIVTLHLVHLPCLTENSILACCSGKFHSSLRRLEISKCVHVTKKAYLKAMKHFALIELMIDMEDCVDETCTIDALLMGLHKYPHLIQLEKVSLKGKKEHMWMKIQDKLDRRLSSASEGVGRTSSIVTKLPWKFPKLSSLTLHYLEIDNAGLRHLSNKLSNMLYLSVLGLVHLNKTGQMSECRIEQDYRILLLELQGRGEIQTLIQSSNFIGKQYLHSLDVFRENTTS